MNTGKTSPCDSGERSVLSLSKDRVRGLLELALTPALSPLRRAREHFDD